MFNLINGTERAALSGKTIPVYNPANGSLIDTVPAAAKEDLEMIFQAAKEGSRLWKSTPLRERCACVKRLAGLIAAHREELSKSLSEETGKSMKDARTELAKIDAMAEGYAERALHLYSEVLSPAQAGSEKDLTITRREPLGVVVCIIPFNYPVSLYTQKVAPALVMGNAVVVKPATDCPLTLTRITRLFWEAGVPGNVIQLVTGRGSDIGDDLVTHPAVHGITLTGSTKAGVRVAELSAKRLTHVHLELGGNDAIVIFEDADLDQAVAEVVGSRSKNAGQTCASTKRIVIQNNVKDAFTERLISALQKVRVGNPAAPATDVGCLISEDAAKEVEEQVVHTLSQGARLLLGGKRDGAFFPMTVLGDVTEEMDVAKDLEIFGPVFPVIGFENEEDAVRIVNASCYGLCAGVMSGDLYRAIRVSQQLDAGSVVVNGSGNYRPPELGFGGYKMSGIGREGISVTLEEMSQLKSYTVKGIALA